MVAYMRGCGVTVGLSEEVLHYSWGLHSGWRNGCRRTKMTTIRNFFGPERTNERSRWEGRIRGSRIEDLTKVTVEHSANQQMVLREDTHGGAITKIVGAIPRHHPSTAETSSQVKREMQSTRREEGTKTCTPRPASFAFVCLESSTVVLLIIIFLSLYIFSIILPCYSLLLREPSCGNDCRRPPPSRSRQHGPKVVPWWHRRRGRRPMCNCVIGTTTCRNKNHWMIMKCVGF